MQDIRQWDLPGLITEVNEWERRLLSEGLVDAVEASWQVGNFRNAVQDAFIYLEEALRGVGQIPRTEGMTANALVDRLLAPNSSDRIHLSGMSPQGPQTSGEQQGVMLLFKAAFLLFRNAVGHRFIAYTPEQADDVIRLVSLCLRILGTEHTRPVVINVPVANWTETIARQVKVLIEKYPGRSSIYLHLTDDGKTTILRLGDEYRVQPTPDLFRELKGLLTDMEVLENDDFPDSRSAGGPPT